MADSRVVWTCLGKERMAAVLGDSMGKLQKREKHHAVTRRWSFSLSSTPAPQLHLQRLNRI